MTARTNRRRRCEQAAEFAQATVAYWLCVFPLVARELRYWQVSARDIPDAILRDRALQALGKRGNMEGAAAFATFVPPARRAVVVRATVAFQAAYNYVDVLAENQSSSEPFESARALHHALVVAVDRTEPPVDYYELYGRHRDGGHLAAMVDACRSALGGLPSYNAVAPVLRGAVERVVSFQAYQARSDAEGGAQAMECWARELVPPGAEMRWWEAAGAAGSSLGAHALLGAASWPDTTRERAWALDDAYFPWMGALHSLLDHLVDVEEDASIGQRNLIGCYEGLDDLVQSIGLLAAQARSCARSLRPGNRHELIVAAMAAFYLSSPQALAPRALAVREAVAAALGPQMRAACTVLGLRRAAGRVYYAGRRHGDHRTADQTFAILAPGR